LIIRGFSNFYFRLWGNASWDELCDILTFCVVVGYYSPFYLHSINKGTSFFLAAVSIVLEASGCWLWL
jgi:hypothetical protein